MGKCCLICYILNLTSYVSSLMSYASHLIPHFSPIPIMKLKHLILVLAAFSAFSAYGQAYILNQPKVRFFSDAPLEDIEAVSTEAQGAISTEKNTFSFRIPIKSFQFEKELMQEHFNENYLESEKYPNSTFKGTIEGKYDLAKDGEYAVVAKGDFDIHGVVQKREIPATIKVKGGVATISSKFMVKLTDHKIEIPTLVFQKIAEQVEVTIEAALKPYSK